jgi:hypothetical protein
MVSQTYLLLVKLTIHSRFLATAGARCNQMVGYLKRIAIVTPDPHTHLSI